MSEVEEGIVRLHALVEGRVQGVGFRYFVQEKAIINGLVGWVRNRWDRSVEVVAEGKRAELDILLNELKRGPRASLVSNVKPSWQPATGEFGGFHIRPTR